MALERPDASNDLLKNPQAPAIMQAMDEIKASIEKLGPQDWAKARDDVKDEPPESQMMVENALVFLQSVRNLQNFTPTLSRVARQLPEIAKASQILELHSDGLVAHAVRRLADAAYHFATPEMQEEAGVVLGGRTPEEIEAARERASKMNIR